MSGEIVKRLNQITNDLTGKKLAEEGFRYFRAITPIRSGNARSRTSLSGDTIYADYPYATRLDNGYSRQAPAGMSKPTDAHMKQFIQGKSKGK
jgi:hypothetical protein